ncbi:hypothetical protein, partial [Cryobacterium sp. TMT3-29-2]|uniref:hypothetical protein n=1 Tax=Cryobacterium sp. TMT3-29-2 TaxID=2555867 RepID=UPI001A7E0B74
SWTNSRISAALNPGLIDIPLPPTACEVTHKQLDAEGAAPVRTNSTEILKRERSPGRFGLVFGKISVEFVRTVPAFQRSNVPAFQPTSQLANPTSQPTN